MKNITIILLFILAHFSSYAQNPSRREIDAFIQKTGAVATIDKATNSLNYLRFPIERPLEIEGNSPDQKALNFLRNYSGLFDIQPAEDTYLTKENKRDQFGLEHAVLQQHYKGVPVYDGVMKFHFNKNSAITSVNGNFIPADKLNATPTISQVQAAQRAIKLVTDQKMGKFSAPLKVHKNTLYVFQKGLAQGYQGLLHLVYEVEVRNDADVREFLYIDAHTRELVEQFTGMHGIDRKLYETAVSAPNLKWQEADGIAGAKYNALDQWQKSEIDATGHIYSLMKNAFGHSSYDGSDAPMITTNNDPNIACPNANWNGITTNYCTGVASDDVVAHEWAHAYTEYTSGLIYAWQAGAMNESYSDIWGETVDQLNAYMDNGESLTLRNGCASSAKWRIGEQATAFGAAIRDMWDPTCNGDPGKMTDQQYWCGWADNGGVHTNSGILNHAYALLADGGTYNGQIIKGLGLTKAAHIFWHAQDAFMSSTTDFAAQADLLEAAMIELIGVDLPKLSTEPGNNGLSGIKITALDVQELKNVLLAVEMRGENGCGFQVLFKPVSASCIGASKAEAFFFEDFENGMGSWLVSNISSEPTWTPRNWVIDPTPPAGRTGHVAFADNFKGGDCVSDFQNGLMSFTSPVITIPATAAGPFILAFDHYVSLEQGSDGGNISYKIGSGEWQLVPKSAFTDNPYNTTSIFGDANPLQDQAGFTGGDAGAITSSWGQSRIDLNKLGLLPGQNISFRWDLGTGRCGGWDGWYIDDVKVYSCTIPTVQFVSTNSTINENEANIPGLVPNICLPYIEKNITIKINKAPSKPVTVTLNAFSETAVEGINADYSIVSKTFVLQAGSLSKDILVRVYNDAYVEGNEAIKLTYTLSNPEGGDATPETFNQQHMLTIADNDLVPGKEVEDVVSANFNSGLDIGWTVIGGGDFPQTWDVVTLFMASLDPDGPPMLHIRSDYNNGLTDKIVETPPFNSIGMTSINLQYLENFQVKDSPNDFDEKALIDVWDGTAWNNILEQNEDTGSSGSYNLPYKREISIPIQFANPAMKIRFRYIASNDYFWSIDNVKVALTYNSPIQSAVSPIPDSQYLGPNETVHFRDPTSGDLIAKIKNLSAHDYGCTSVQVDRAGNDETAWVGGHKITKKTFKVTPTNNNPAGKYEITLYYKAAELANFNGNTIKSMGKSEGGIAQATVTNSSAAPVQMAPFNNDFAYTATFSTGFSGFGLSDSPPAGPLPVTLVRFEGRHTREGNLLDWETSSEVNNDYFVVERSWDARKFAEIARIAGIGNSAIRNAYHFTDVQFANGSNYYRLKQVDKDGNYAYSRMIVIEAISASELKTYPNPVHSQVHIELPNKNLQQVSLKIVNSAGQVVWQKERVKVSNGTLSHDISRLPAGIYQIIVSDEKTAYNLTVAKVE